MSGRDPVITSMVVRQVVGELDELEAELSREIQRLATDPWRSARTSGGTIRGKPPWWWRTRLLEWATSSRARRRLDPSDLRAFRTFLRHLPDDQVGVFVLGTLPESGSLEDSA